MSRPLIEETTAYRNLFDLARTCDGDKLEAAIRAHHAILAYCKNNGLDASQVITRGRSRFVETQTPLAGPEGSMPRPSIKGLITDTEARMLTHVQRHGPDGYPVKKVAARSWSWDYGTGPELRESKRVFPRKAEAVASFEAHLDELRDKLAGRVPGLSYDQRRFVQSTLSNDEASTDAELLEHFVSQGLNRDACQFELDRRGQYLKAHPASPLARV